MTQPLGTLLGLRFAGRSRTALLALLAVSILATIGVVSGLEVRRGAGDRIDRLFVENGRPDLVLSGGPDGLPAAVAEADAEGLIDEASLFDAAFASFPRPDGTAVGLRLLMVDAQRIAPVGAPILGSGRWAEASDELVLETAAANQHGHELGDTVDVQRDGITHPLILVGTAVDLSDCFYPNCLPVRGYLSETGMEAIAPDGVYARAHLRLAEGLDPEVAADRLAESELVDRIDPWPETRSNLLLPGRVFAAFLAGFGGFVLIATLLVVAGTAAGSVIARRRELGLLKALGATPGQLLAVTVLEQVLVGLVGVAVGWVGGSLLAPWLEIGLVDGLGRAEPVFRIDTLITAGLAVTITLAAATLAPARRAGALTTRAAMSDAPPTVTGRSGRLLARLPLSPPGLLGTQLALARPFRAVLAATAVGVALAAGVAGWRLNVAVDAIADDPARVGNPYDVNLNVPVVDDEMIASTLASVPGVGGWYRESGGIGALDDREVAVRAIGPEVGDAALVVVEGRVPTAPGEALAGWGLLRDGRVAIGDTVEVEIADAVLPVTVVGRHGDLSGEGDVLVVSMATFEEAAGPVRSAWRVAASDGVDRDDLAVALEEAFDGRALAQPATERSRLLTPFRIVLAALVALVGAVAAANLGATLAAGARERRRELGVVRALGFSEAELRRQTMSGGTALGLVGVGIGVPAGLLGSALVTAGAADQVGLGPGLVEVPTVAPAAVAALVGLVSAAAVGLVSTRGVRAAPATELVREV